MSLTNTVSAQFVTLRGLTSAQLGVVINDSELNSVEIGEYYRKARGIPVENIVHVQIPHRPRKLDATEFETLKAKIDAKLSLETQAVLMIWTAPYAVECNSITAAYTMGLDSALCTKPCAPSKPSPYYNATSTRPYTDLKLRLSMLLPIESVENAKALIDRVVASGIPPPQSSPYRLQTSDLTRSSRSRSPPYL